MIELAFKMLCFLGLAYFSQWSCSLLAMCMPITRVENQTREIWRVKIENCMIAGPGQRPPMPHPNPKDIAPNTSFLSTVLLLGLNSYLPINDFCLYNIQMYLTLSM